MAKKRKRLVDDLPEKRRLFVLAYLGEAKRNQSEAARIAGYKQARMEGGRLMTDDAVVAAIEELQREMGDDTDSRVMQIAELRAFWSAVARGEHTEQRVAGELGVIDVDVAMKDRLRASELLGKSGGAFVTEAKVQIVDAPKTVEEARQRLAAMAAVIGAAESDSGDDDEEGEDE